MATDDLCTLDDLEDQFSTPVEDSALAESLITAASIAIREHPRVQREFTPKTSSAVARTFRVDGTLVRLVGPLSDLRGTPTLVRLHPEDASPITLALNVDYALTMPARPGGISLALRLAGDASLCSSFAQKFGHARIEITGTWGTWDTADVPGDVRRACALTVAAWMDRGATAYAQPDADEGVVYAPTRTATYAVPTAALQLLAPYRRPYV